MIPEEPIPDPAKLEKKKSKKKLALEKLRVTFERSQLAWIRTSLTFTALGFTAYRVFRERLEEGKQAALSIVNGQQIGIFLIIVGFASLLFATLQHINNQAKLKAHYDEMKYSITLLVSYVLLVFTGGLLAMAFIEL
jgi:uncharacterized membrane protein YidH (DUF202 family)